jgi:hypothetical protein
MKHLGFMTMAAATTLVAALSTTNAAAAENGAADHARSQRSDSSYGTITPDMRREIDRVMSARDTMPRSRTAAATDLAASAVRCASFEDQRYCLHFGWTELDADAVRQRVADALVADERREATSATGAQSIASVLAEHRALPVQAQVAREREMLETAARSVGKVIRLRHQIENDPVPADFHRNHPEMEEGMQALDDSLDERGSILSTSKVNDQNRTYWCGPGSMQMIHWNWGGNSKVKQGTWANRLNTSTSGTSIWNMVRTTNDYTGWDRADRAGTYIVLDISGYSFSSWFSLNTRHYHDYRAPVVLHPILLKEYFPYLDDNGSGHFQVGRGWDYNLNDSKPKKISYFEPWNQQKFNPSEPFIARVQWRNAINSYRANKAHSMQNIGV